MWTVTFNTIVLVLVNEERKKVIKILINKCTQSLSVHRFLTPNINHADPLTDCPQNHVPRFPNFHMNEIWKKITFSFLKVNFSLLEKKILLKSRFFGIFVHTNVQNFRHITKPSDSILVRDVNSRMKIITGIPFPPLCSSGNCYRWVCSTTVKLWSRFSSLRRVQSCARGNYNALTPSKDTT